MPASAWNSYLETLNYVLDTFKPKYVFEYGTGYSTFHMCRNDSILRLFSVEHDEKYFKRVKSLMNRFNGKLHIEYEPNIDEYAQIAGDCYPYDLVFIDGTNRQRCIREAKKLVNPETGIILLHDSDREEYQEAISEYAYSVPKDNGCTCLLTDSKDVYEMLNSSAELHVRMV